MKFGSLFSGIGGMDLGLERAGMECKWQVEIDDYCQRVLNKHWPDVRRYEDVKEIHGIMAHSESEQRRYQSKNLADGSRREGRGQPGSRSIDERSWQGICPTCIPSVDLIAGGFPCQPHSVAGKRKGAEDDRNLWPEFIRIIREIKPKYVLAENVPGIITTYIDTVLSDLEGQGYACSTLNIPAIALDAPHRRERIFIVGYSEEFRRNETSTTQSGEHRQSTIALGRSSSFVADTDRTRKSQSKGNEQAQRGWSINGCEALADADQAGLSEPARGRIGSIRESQRQSQGSELGRGDTAPRTHWTVEPSVGRVAHGISSRVHRLRGLGNAVVPQVAEWIGKRIMEFDGTP